MRRYLLPLVGLLVCAAVVFYNWLRLNEEWCRLDNRNGYNLNVDRQIIRDSCWRNRNPFIF